MIQNLMRSLDESTCNFLAVACIARQLKEYGFTELNPADSWHLQPGAAHYVIKNGTAIFAFRVGTGTPAEQGFRIISAHSDSPCFKLKPNPEIYGDGGVVSLNVEKYGGGIMYTWFDRPLSLSGRVMLRSYNPLRPEERLIDLRRPVCTIPHLAIHFNRGLNDGNPLSVQKDMKPVLGYYPPEQIEEQKKHGGAIQMLIAEHLGVKPEDIIGSELNLYPLQKAELVGANSEYLQSGRIDDLSMAFTAMEAIKDAAPCEATQVIAIFDNEETGSATKQGAHSPVLRQILHRIAGEGEDFYRAIEHSFMISADDAHAWHPNYNEKYDPTNHPVIGKGPVIKINANCKYMTDAQSAAVFRQFCTRAGVECQYFVNHGDVAGGSTLGNILTAQIDLRGVDMGCAIWGMHSAAETAGVSDHEDTLKVFSEFFRNFC